MTVLLPRWALRKEWQEDDHPRDHRGRFIEVGSWVRAWTPGVGETVGEVMAAPGGGQLQVRTRAGWVAMVAARDVEGSNLRPTPPVDPPATATVRDLLDPDSGVTPAKLGARLAAGDGSPQERAEWAAAISWFHDAAERAKADDHAISYLGAISASPDPAGAVAATMPHLAGDAKAALMQMLHGELAHRNGEPAGLRHGVRRWDGTADGALWAERNMQAPEGLTREEIDAARAYIKSPTINAALRGKMAATDDDQAQAAALDAAMAKNPVPQPILVTRGTSVAALEGVVQGRDDDEGMLGLVGQILTEPGYLSTAISPEPPQDFAAADVQWLIRVPRDTPALYLGVPPFDTIDGEQELLLGRGQRLLVHGVYRGPDRTYRPPWGGERTISGQWFVEAEIVPADWRPNASWTPEPYGDAYAAYGDGSNAWME